jgi:hypothetical protein
MEYPRDFPVDAEARVEAEKILAEQMFDAARITFIREYEKDKDRRFVTALLIDCILRIVETFGEEACLLGKRRIWTVSAVDTHTREFLKSLSYEFARERGYDNHGSPLPDLLSSGNPGEISFEFENCLRQSNQWVDFQRNRHWVAVWQSLPDPTSLGPIAAPIRMPGPQLVPPEKSLSDILDDLVLKDDLLTHEELADRIKIARSTYFLVKGGGGGKKAKLKVRNYLKTLKLDG